MAYNETECSPSEVCLSDSDNELLIPTPWSDESNNEKRAKKWKEEFEWKRSLFKIDLTFGINAFDLDKGTESIKDNGMDDHVPDEMDGAKCEQLPNLVVKKGSGVGVDTTYPRHGYAVSSLMDMTYWLSE
ncbi:hypothetical protein Tco_1284388 [Tanacetum coccineum]